MIKGIKDFNILLLSLCFAIVVHPTHLISTNLDLGAYSKHYLDFGKLNQLLPHVNYLPAGKLPIIRDVEMCHSY